MSIKRHRPTIVRADPEQHNQMLYAVWCVIAAGIRRARRQNRRSVDRVLVNLQHWFVREVIRVTGKHPMDLKS